MPEQEQRVVEPPIAGAAGAGASVGAGAGAGSSAFLPQDAKESTSAPDANSTTNFFIFILRLLSLESTCRASRFQNIPKEFSQSDSLCQLRNFIFSNLFHAIIAQIPVFWRTPGDLPEKPLKKGLPWDIMAQDFIPWER